MFPDTRDTQYSSQAHTKVLLVLFCTKLLSHGLYLRLPYSTWYIVLNTKQVMKYMNQKWCSRIVSQVYTWVLMLWTCDKFLAFHEFVTVMPFRVFMFAKQCHQTFAPLPWVSLVTNSFIIPHCQELCFVIVFILALDRSASCSGPYSDLMVLILYVLSLVCLASLFTLSVLITYLPCFICVWHLYLCTQYICFP